MELIKKLECKYCYDTIKLPITLKCCGYSFCWGCLSSMPFENINDNFTNREIRKCPNCPKYFDLSTYSSSVMLNDIMSEIEIECECCKLKIKCGQYATHLRETCDYRWECEWCKFKISPALTKHAHDRKCPSFIVGCEKCGERCERKNLNNHKCDKECYRCEVCDNMVLVKDIDEHSIKIVYFFFRNKKI